jgi:hypothetical protein
MKYLLVILFALILLASCKKEDCSNCTWDASDLRTGKRIGTATYQSLLLYDKTFNRDNICKDAVVGKSFSVPGGNTYVISKRECN